MSLDDLKISLENITIKSFTNTTPEQYQSSFSEIVSVRTI